MKQMIFAASVLLLGVGCKKDLIDFEPGVCYEVQTLLDSRNADVPCGKTADFEGKKLCLTGTLEDNGNSTSFTLRDAQHSSNSIEIQVDSLLVVEILAKVKAHEHKMATVRGIMTGFDKPQNFKCRRGFAQQLSDVEDLEIQ